MTQFLYFCHILIALVCLIIKLLIFLYIFSSNMSDTRTAKSYCCIKHTYKLDMRVLFAFVTLLYNEVLLGAV